MMRRAATAGWLAGAAAMLACAVAVAAQPAAKQTPPQTQPNQQPSGAMQGLSANRDQPVRITANTLEVRDKQHQATFTGEVKLVQGDATVTCRTLVVFYEDNPITSAKKGGAADPQPQKGPNAPNAQNTQIKRAEAKGDVLITQKDQSASGDNGVYDAKANTMTLVGNVVVTQGATVMRGERMTINLETGITKVDKGPGGQIEFMTTPGAKDGPGKDAPAAKDGKSTAPAAAPAQKSAPKGPIRIN
jgi:lipopolysaccharide export system protein LptA